MLPFGSGSGIMYKHTLKRGENMNHTDISSTAVLKEFINCPTLDSCFKEYWRVRKEHPELEAVIDATFVGIISKYVGQDDIALSINPSFPFESGKQRQAYYKMKEFYYRLSLQDIMNRLKPIQEECLNYQTQEMKLIEKQKELKKEQHDMKEEYRLKRFPKLWQGVVKQYYRLMDFNRGISLGVSAATVGVGAVCLSLFPATTSLAIAALFGVTGLHEMVTSKDGGFITDRRRLLNTQMDNLRMKLEKNRYRLQNCRERILTDRNQIECAMLQMDNIQNNADTCHILQKKDSKPEDSNTFEVNPTMLSEKDHPKQRTLHLSRRLSHTSK